jgi:hypothetical protein
MFNFGDVVLRRGDVRTHVHLKGISQSGKSKLIELFCRLLLDARIGWVLIDPHGKTTNDLLPYLAMYAGKRQKVYLVDPKSRTCGFNPFRQVADYDGAIISQAAELTESILKNWKQTPDQFPGLTRILQLAIETILADCLPIAALPDLLRKKAGLKTSRREMWAVEYKEKGYENTAGGALNRISPLMHPLIHKLMGKPSIVMEEVIQESGAVIFNLQPSHDLEFRRTRMIGTMAIDAIWRAIQKSQSKKDFWVIVDEAQEFTTPDFSAFLDQAAKRGLHLAMAHQRNSQLDRNTLSALDNAPTKIFFSQEDARKPERHFELTHADGEIEPGIVKAVDPIYPSKQRMESFFNTMFEPFKEQDEYTDEIQEEDFYR